MAKVSYSTTAKLPVQAIWDFVEDMDNWAPLVTGYQSHQKHNRDDSEWVLKGDLGSLTRTLKFKVRVLEWAGPSRVDFELEGINEQMTGSGQFLMEPYEETDGAPPPPPPAAPGFFARLIEAFMRFFFRRATGDALQRRDATDRGPAAGMARLSFDLRVDPAGPMAPMINAMVKPAMVVAAEDLASRIIDAVESRTQASGQN